MMGRTHVITGACTGCWYAAVLPVPDLVRLICVAVVAIAATFPDIDHHNGMVTRAIWPFTHILSWIVRGAPFYIPFVGWGGRLWRGVRHRGALHYPRTALWAGLVGCALAGVAAFVLALSVPSPYWSYWWAVGGAIGVGWLTHLVWDARTHSGIPVGSNRHFRLGNPDAWLRIFRTIRTGSPDEVRVRRFWFAMAWLSGIGMLVVTR